MNKTIQTILLVLLFAMFAVLGYILVGTQVQKRPAEAATEAAVEVPDTDVPVTAPAAGVAGPRVIEVDSPAYQAKTGLYLFRAKGEGNNIVFYLADNNRSTINGSAQHTTDALFEVNPTPSGVYYVYVVDAENHQSEFIKVEGCTPKAVPTVKKVSAEELASILSGKNTSAARTALDGRIAPSCKFNCQGLSESEEAPTSYVEVISRLKRSWESIRVTGVDYDAQGRIKSVNLSVTQKQQ